MRLSKCNQGKTGKTNHNNLIELIEVRIFEDWNRLAGKAYEGYLIYGRGLILIDVIEASEKTMTVALEFVADRDGGQAGGWPDEFVANAIKEYDPSNEFLCLVVDPDETNFLRISTPPDRPSPREVAYERAHERVSDAHIPQC